VGSQIRKLFRGNMFNNLLQDGEKKAWGAFRLVPPNFLGNITAENYKELIKTRCHCITNLIAICP
jgi:hypothetical protein